MSDEETLNPVEETPVELESSETEESDELEPTEDQDEETLEV